MILETPAATAPLEHVLASLDVDFIDGLYGHSFRRLDDKGKVIENVHPLQQGFELRGSHVRKLKTAFRGIKSARSNVQSENRLNTPVLVQQGEDELPQVA